jgi:hypothetical protein
MHRKGSVGDKRVYTLRRQNAKKRIPVNILPTKIGLDFGVHLRETANRALRSESSREKCQRRGRLEAGNKPRKSAEGQKRAAMRPEGGYVDLMNLTQEGSRGMVLRRDRGEIGNSGSTWLGGQMLRSLRFSCAAILLLSGSLLCSLARAQKMYEPLTEGEIMRLLQGSVPPERVGQLAREHGTTFEVTPAVERDLRDAGATPELLEILRQLSPKPAQPPS